MDSDSAVVGCCCCSSAALTMTAKRWFFFPFAAVRMAVLGKLVIGFRVDLIVVEMIR